MEDLARSLARLPLYAATGNITIDVGPLTQDEAADRIVAEIDGA